MSVNNFSFYVFLWGPNRCLGQTFNKNKLSKRNERNKLGIKKTNEIVLLSFEDSTPIEMQILLSVE